MAEQLVYTAEKAIKDNGAKVSPEIVKGVEDKVADLKKAISPSTGSGQGTDIEAIKKASEALSSEMQKIGEEIMKAQKTEQPKTDQGASGQEGGEKKDDNIKDADYKEKK